MLFSKHAILVQICNLPLEFVWWVYSILLSNGDTDDCMLHGRKAKKITAGQMSGSNFVLYKT